MKRQTKYEMIDLDNIFREANQLVELAKEKENR